MTSDCFANCNLPRGDLQTPQRGLKIGCKSTKNIGNNYICTQKNDLLLANFLHLFIKREKFVNVISFNHWIGGFSSIPSGGILIELSQNVTRVQYITDEIPRRTSRCLHVCLRGDPKKHAFLKTC